MKEQRIIGLGDAGSYGDCVAQWLNKNEYLGEANIVFAESNEAVLSLVASSEAPDIGVVPVYNSSAGYVVEVMRWLMRQEDQRQEHLSVRSIANPYLFAMRRISLRIHHQLLGCDPTTDTGGIKTVVSHPQALEQCREHLSGLGKVTLKPFSSTASAARWVAEQADPTIAAIASPFCAGIYGLTALEGNFEDDENNYTHFYVFEKCHPLPSKIHLLLSDPVARDALGLLEEGNIRHILSTGIALLLWPSRSGHGVLHDI